MSIEDDQVPDPFSTAQQVMDDYHMGICSETPCPTPESPCYDPYAWENTHKEVVEIIF